MQTPFELFIPQNLTFQDYLAIIQTARTWADGYDLKSYPHLISTLAPQVTVDYSAVNPAWGSKVYDKDAFAKLWLSEEHLGNTVLNTQHLLGLPYFSYVGKRRTDSDCTQSKSVPDVPQTEGVEEIEVSWQILASHARHTAALHDSDDIWHPQISETSDHRAFITHLYIKVETQDADKGRKSSWRLASIKPQPVYIVGDFERVRRPAGTP